MIEWWQSMDFTQQIFAVIAIASTILLVIQIVLLAIGFGDSGGADSATTDVNIDPSVDLDITPDGVHLDIDAKDSTPPVDSGLKLFTIQGIIAFFAIFGWSGLIMLKADTQPVLAVALAIIFGFIALFVMAVVLKSMLKLQNDGTLNIKNAIGKSGSVYLTIPAKRSNTGKINVLIQERLVELDAVTDSEESIPTGTEVKITGIANGNTLIVAKF